MERSFMEKSSDFNPRFSMNKCSYGMRLPNDRISPLPVDILLIILSFLPLKDMVKTSILSRRWLNLWVNTPVLDFCLVTPGFDFSNMMRDYFVNWVNHVLPQHKGPYLKKFRICCNIMNDRREDINRWLEFALARKVEILELDFLLFGDPAQIDYNYVFPDCWVSKDGRANVDGGKSRVLQFDLKLLKSLSLKNVNVTGETIYFFLRNCPFLERLELVGNNRLVNLVISDPTLVLKYLQVKVCRGLKVLSISNFNLVSLETTVGNLILKDLPMLVELSIFGTENNLKVILSQNATCLRQLESLKLHAFHLEEMTKLPSNLAQMKKLKRLVINYRPRADESLIALLSLVKSCTHLEEFVLEMKCIKPNCLRRQMRSVERATCESLKFFEFKGYCGRASDAELILHLVMNAPGLEKIIIDPYDLSKCGMILPVYDHEQYARRLASHHIRCLRNAKCIPPHVNVLIRELDVHRVAFEE